MSLTKENIMTHTQLNHLIDQCPTTLKMLHHIFKKQKRSPTERHITSLELFFDYLQMLLFEPEQQLPALILQSHGMSGKTVFWNWIGLLMEHHMKFKSVEGYYRLDLHDLKSDEGMVVVEGVCFGERFLAKTKEIVTTTKVIVNPKFGFPFEVDKCIRVGGSSNVRCVETNYLWFVQVDQLKPDDVDPYISEKLKSEIDKFNEFIINYKVQYPKKTRVWFDLWDLNSNLKK